MNNVNLEFKRPIRDMEVEIDDYLCGITEKHLLEYISANTMSYLWDIESVNEVMVFEEIYSLTGEENV